MQYLNIHTHSARQIKGVESILSLSIGHDDFIENQPVAVGMHPWLINLDTWETDLDEVRKLANQPNVKMIGECGLDKLKGPDLGNQIEIFEAQLEIAKAVRKPLIIHCVRAYDELIFSYNKVDPKVALVIHGFNKNEQMGRQLMQQGFYLSFGKVILNKLSGAVALLKNSEDFFLETDDEDHSIGEIYAAAAKIKNCSIHQLKEVIFANWKKLNLI